MSNSLNEAELDRLRNTKYDTSTQAGRDMLAALATIRADRARIAELEAGLERARKLYGQIWDGWPSPDGHSAMRAYDAELAGVARWTARQADVQQEDDVSEQCGKFMTIEQVPTPGSKCCEWSVYDRHGGALGRITYHCGWRQYIFEPYGGAIFSRGCMADLMGFMFKHKDDRNANL